MSILVFNLTPVALIAMPKRFLVDEFISSMDDKMFYMYRKKPKWSALLRSTSSFKQKI